MGMKYFLFLFLFISFYSCNQNQTDPQTGSKDSAAVVKVVSTGDDLITESGFGKINKSTTYADLLAIFGKENLQDTVDYGPEALDTFIVTKIYSNTSREIVVKWQKDKFHKAIGAVECYQENSPYQTMDSLKVGSTLDKLVQANGKKITFYGTGWDYGGLITSYNKGRYEKSEIFFFLNSRDDASEDIMGDQELNTDMPKVKSNLNKIYIAKISLSLNSDR